MPYVAVDVETSGMNPVRGARVLECAAVQVSNGRIAREFSRLINVPCTISSEAGQVHGITRSMLDGQPPPREVWTDFLQVIGDSTLIAHNARFDVHFIQHELARLGKGLINQSICTLQMAERRYPRLGNYKLEFVARHVLGTLPEDCELHRALGHARLVARIWLAMEGTS